MSELQKYRYSEMWGRQTKTFAIEIKRWSYESTGENIWNIYVYLYPEHPLFDKCTEEYYGADIEFHGGNTYFKWYRNKDGFPTCKMYGCDYNHYEDDEFIASTTLSESSEIFRDAEEIFNYLSKEEVE